MYMDERFVEIVAADIQKGHEIVDNRMISECNEFHERLISKYAPIIDGFDKHLQNLFYDNDKKICLRNIKTMVEKLELFVAMGYKNIYSDKTPQTIINNSNTNNVDISISFENAKKQIEEMSALTDTEVEEIIKKIDELKNIVDSNDRKTKKWENAKGIIKWIADKGADVGLTLLPLLLQIK